MKTVLLKTYEQASYWWIKIIRAKVRSIEQNGSFSSEDDKEFLRIFGKLTEEKWREIYLQLSKRIESYISKGVFSQNTGRNGHPLINKELSTILGVQIPCINLSNKNGKVYRLDVHSQKVCEICESKKKLPNTYDESYNYILSDDDEELEFYYLLLSIIINIRKKSNDVDSLTFIKSFLCDKYVEDEILNNYRNIPREELDGKVRELAEEFNKIFNKVIQVFKEYSIIKVESCKGEEVITMWPMEIEGIREESYSDEIIKKYKDRNLDNQNSVRSISRKERKKAREILIECTDRSSLVAIEKVLDEMNSTEDNLGNTSSYSEELSEAFCIALSNASEELLNAIASMHNDYYSLVLKDVIGLEERKKEPLKSVDLSFEGEYECEFSNVKWEAPYKGGMISISFNSDGTIKIEKTSKAGNDVDYTANFNVMSPDFEVSISDKTVEKCSISLKDNKIIERFNNIEVVNEFHFDEETMDAILVSSIIRINQKRGDASIIYEANRTINGGVEYTGVKINLPDKTYYFSENEFMMLEDKSLDIDKEIVDEIKLRFSPKQYMPTTNEELDMKRKIWEDLYDKNRLICDVESKIIEKLMAIRKECPVPGLISRIDRCLSFRATDEKEGPKTYRKVGEQ